MIVEEVVPPHKNKIRLPAENSESFDEHFKPNGAIAFFVLLVLLGLIIWFGIYSIMLQRV